MKLTTEFQHISHDELDTCANYARLEGDKVEIKTLYRYGKPCYRIISKDELNRLINKGLL